VANGEAARHRIEFALTLNAALRIDCISHQSSPFDLTRAIIRAGAATFSDTALVAMWRGSRKFWPGLVSKHRERAYRAGRSPHWIKVKNRAHASLTREF
jgi:hypothetical protein